MTDHEAAVVTVCAFMAGFTLGIAAAVRERKNVDTPQYVPTPIACEVAKLLEPEDLEQAAFLVERDGLVGYLVKAQQAN